MAFSFLLNNDQTKHESTSNCSKIKEPSLSNEVFLEGQCTCGFPFFYFEKNKQQNEGNKRD